MPLMDRPAGRRSGNADTFEAALVAFKAAFIAWHADLPPELWQQNIDYMRRQLSGRARKADGGQKSDE